MNLTQYLNQEGMTVREFAEKLGISKEHLSGVKTGRYRPSNKLCKKIANLTDGKVIFIPKKRILKESEYEKQVQYEFQLNQNIDKGTV